jgi:hypothetical protein
MKAAIVERCAELLPKLEAAAAEAEHFVQPLMAARELCAADFASEALQMQAAMTLGFIAAMLEMLG